MDEGGSGIDGMAGRPRKSWQMRKRQERAAIKEGLAEWQARTELSCVLMQFSDRAEHALAMRTLQERAAIWASLAEGQAPFCRGAGNVGCTIKPGRCASARSALP